MIIKPAPRSECAIRATPGAAALLLALFLGGSPAAALCDASSQFLPPRPNDDSRPAPPREAVLTFDAAWSSDGAEEILDELGNLGVRATFFLAGCFVKEHPAIARRIIEEGHEVGNHTFSHAHLTRYAEDGSQSSLPEVTRISLDIELESARREFEEATGRQLAPIWRAPYGEINAELIAWARQVGYTHVGWSSGLDTLDWVSDQAHRLYRPPGAAARRVLALLARREPREGPAVILMHLGSDRPPVERFGRELPSVIRGAERLGYRFVTASQALREGKLP